MKKVFCFFAAFVVILGNNIIFADDDDDVPYLSDDDIAAIEVILPSDTPTALQEVSAESGETEETIEKNEISRLNTIRTIYHLLILDRSRCSSNADIVDISNNRFLYKFKHGANGYLIALYTSPGTGPVFPQFPDRANILVDLITTRKSTIREYINSSSFRRFVTSRRILLQIQRALDIRQ
jgi:hypothetical protein